MIICIDSCVFIWGIHQRSPIVDVLFTHIIPTTTLIIPRLVAREVTRNLKHSEHIRRFYDLFHDTPVASIVDEPVPVELVNTYVQMGLSHKGDAFIGAFAEWQQVEYLLSNNRHFLREIQLIYLL